ncbi:MAG: hypothetical protein GX020_07325 [Firmicutes bacterium]|nr:hypothetical protein [Bacillota bacterium]
MTIKFPDFQVLVTRSEQIPRYQREGEFSGAGKLAPQVADEMELRKRKINESKQGTDIRLDEKHPERRHKEKKRKKRNFDSKGHRVDIKV